MFRKLLKYEWRANAKLFWILSAAALGVALLGGGALRAANFLLEASDSDVAIALVVPGMYLLAIFCGLALIGYMAAVEILNLVRFYKNKFTDEGYLTFTLPVKARDIYLSTFVNILLWMLISGVIMLGCFALMIGIGLGDVLRELMQDTFFRDIMGILTEGLGELEDAMVSAPGYGLYSVLTVITTVLSPFYTISVIMGCLTMGSVLAKKHKILASIGVYYGVSVVSSTLSSTLSSIFTLTNTDVDHLFTAYNASAICQILLMIGIIVGSYFLSTYLMKNKLNLP